MFAPGSSLSLQGSRERRMAGEMADMTTFSVGLVDRKSTRLNSSHRTISYAVFCLKKKKIANEIAAPSAHVEVGSLSDKSMRETAELASALSDIHTAILLTIAEEGRA